MSGEYYAADKSSPKFFHNDFAVVPTYAKKEKIDQIEFSNKGNRLSDIGEQLEMAENKCNNLKGQLDYMKQVYGTQKKSRKISSVRPDLSKTSDDDTFNQSSSSVSVKSSAPKAGIQPKTQTSNVIGTDNTGAAVRTINNILSGISDSVNRLSELHVQISDTPRKLAAKNNVSEDLPTTSYLQQSTNKIQNFNPNNRSVSHIKLTKKKCKDHKMGIKKQTSIQAFKRSVKVDRRATSASYSPREMARKLTPFIRTRSSKATSSYRDRKIVEIFHNSEAKNSDSEDDQKIKLLHTVGENQPTFDTNKDVDVPALELANTVYQEVPCHTRRLCQNVVPGDYYQHLGNRPEGYQKSYEYPTIASRMKQVAKSYLNTFSFKSMVSKIVGEKMEDDKISMPRKTIPFCAAISTSPSHNTGINIQQVMNILKNRQPINGISPTLAHNIGLAAERLNSKPLSTLVSTINSNTCYVKPQQCPLSKCKLNYQYLQNLARTIPEETVEEAEGEEQTDVKTVIITGPSGDMEIKTKNVPQWTAEKSNHVCTCLPNDGPDINYVCSRVTKKSENLNFSQASICQKPQYRTNKCTNKKEKRLQSVIQPVQPVTRTSTSDSAFEGKEKNLKLVLTHLHDEFEALNKHYEDLSEKATSNKDPEVIKQLESLEAELTKKEEEINMVMTLCKEVMALKQQIKNLKQHNSQSAFPQERQDGGTTSNFNDFKNPQAAFHLTKLLKQIQTYQKKYKHGVGV
ncbi:uncharacterized protein LOC126885912 isoform X1 [Diabrotica virgifera virgifera]|uniref:Uncharacterized protein n=1 Tax=Diabrotica virgifera virgifera TaxID=50390 RepID=A0ABM5KEQ6_DIAVI|nr:uncharacterized protein LOC126885912 isoform X1 [Diabrotica virgifera virgifera]